MPPVAAQPSPAKTPPPGTSTAAGGQDKHSPLWPNLVRALLFVVGAFSYALVGILSRLSKSEDGTYAYSMPSVVLNAEVLKLCLSFIFLAAEEGSLQGVLKALSRGTLKHWLIFTIPSLMYSVNNNIDILFVQHMDPATMQVLVQLKILTTAVTWRIVFRQALGLRKWLALIFLFMGAACAVLPSKAASPEKPETAMFIDITGMVLVTLYVWISAGAGVYNEWLFKSIGKDDSFYVCNIRLYAIGCCFNLYAHLTDPLSYRDPEAYKSGLLTGYNIYTWGLVATFASMGLIIAQVMKYFDNIVKLFISGSAMYCSAFLSWLIFKIEPTMAYCFALVIVTVSLLMFNTEQIPSQVVAGCDMRLRYGALANLRRRKA